MTKIDIEQASWQEVLQAIKESNINYGKDYDIYTYYHYDNGNIVGVVYGWFYDSAYTLTLFLLVPSIEAKELLHQCLRK